MSVRKIDKYSEDFYVCLECRCKFCREDCPVFTQTRNEAHTAHGKMVLAYAIQQGLANYTQSMVDLLAHCTTCGYCRYRCPSNLFLGDFYKKMLDLPTIVEALRADLLKSGLNPMPRHKAIAEWCRKEHNPYMEKHIDKLKWIPEGKTIPQKGDIVYFMGCTEPYRAPELCRTFVKIMEAADVNFAIIPEEWCCGSPFLRIGMLDLAEELVKHNVDAIKRAGAKTVVTPCAGCYRTLKKDYPELIGEGQINFEVVHATEFIKRLIEEGKLDFKKEVMAKVTWHDPCHTGRHVGRQFYDIPRDVLQKIPGVKLFEMRKSKENARCCGAGGGVKSALPDLAIKMGKQRLKDAEETGAEYVVTDCPFCRRNLLDAAEGGRIKVKDLRELVAEAACL